MAKDFYTVQEVANLLDMHVKTIRNYVRDGRLRSTRIGKQYRIAKADLEAFTGSPVDQADLTALASVEVSSITQVDGIGVERANRLTNFLMAAARGHNDEVPLRVDTLFDEERARLKVITLGSVDATVTILELVRKMAGTPER